MDRTNNEAINSYKVVFSGNFCKLYETNRGSLDAVQYLNTCFVRFDGDCISANDHSIEYAFSTPSYSEIQADLKATIRRALTFFIITHNLYCNVYILPIDGNDCFKSFSQYLNSGIILEVSKDDTMVPEDVESACDKERKRYLTTLSHIEWNELCDKLMQTCYSHLIRTNDLLGFIYDFVDQLSRIIFSGCEQKEESRSFKKQALLHLITEHITSCEDLDCYLSHLSRCISGMIPATQNSSIIEDIKVFICNHINSDLTRQDVASEFGYHPVYLAKLFKDATGISINSYTQKQRMMRSLELLKDPSLSISTIADKLGYSSCAHFAKTFKLYYSCTPKEYRKNCNLSNANLNKNI